MSKIKKGEKVIYKDKEYTVEAVKGSQCYLMDKDGKCVYTDEKNLKLFDEKKFDAISKDKDRLDKQKVEDKQSLNPELSTKKTPTLQRPQQAASVSPSKPPETKKDITIKVKNAEGYDVSHSKTFTVTEKDGKTYDSSGNSFSKEKMKEKTIADAAFKGKPITVGQTERKFEQNGLTPETISELKSHGESLNPKTTEKPIDLDGDGVPDKYDPDDLNGDGLVTETDKEIKAEREEQDEQELDELEEDFVELGSSATGLAALAQEANNYTGPSYYNSIIDDTPEFGLDEEDITERTLF